MSLYKYLLSLLALFLLGLTFWWGNPLFAATCNPDITPGCEDDGGSEGTFDPTYITVNIVGTDPNNITWNINPGPPHVGTGNQTKFVAGGETYTISNLDYAGCTGSPVVTNTNGSGASMYVAVTQAKSFTVTYSGCTAQPSAPSADIKIDGFDGTLTNDGNYRVVSKSAGTTAQISWTSANATSCSYTSSGGGPFGSGLAPSGSFAHSGVSNGVYVITLTCTGSGGSASDVIVLNMGNNVASVDLKADATGFQNGSACLGNGSSIAGMQGPVRLDAYDPGVGQCDPYTFPRVTNMANGQLGVPSGLWKFHYTQSRANSCVLSGPGLSQTLGNSSYYESSASYFAPGNDNFWWTKTAGNYIMTATCSGPLGTVSDTLQIQVVGAQAEPPPESIPDYEGDGGGSDPLAPVVVLSVSPSTIAPGSNSTISWTTTNNPTGCTASASPANAQWTGAKNVAGGSQPVTSINQTTTFTLTCTNSYGSDTDSKTVTTVVGGAKPVVDLVASPPSVNQWEDSRLTWTVQNGATSCTGSGGFSGSGWSGAGKNPTGGSQDIIDILATYTYTLTCTNANGNGSDSVSIPVVATPAGLVVDLTANPTTVTSGGSTVLSWPKVLNAIACWGSGSPQRTGWTTFSTKSISGGSETASNMTQSTTFTLTCTDNGGDQVSDSVLVSVSAPLPVPVVTISANPTSGLVNEVNPQLTWSATNNPTSCTASGDWSGSKSTSGSNVSQGVLTTAKTYTYTLTCSNTTGASTPVSATVVVSPASLPDLTAGLVTPNTATAGTALQFSASVINSGLASTGASFSNFFQIASAAGGGGTVTDLSSSVTPLLDQGLSRSISSPLYTFASEGTYSVRVCADKASSGDTGTISESNEFNNCSSSWVNVTVAPPAAVFNYSLSNSGNLSVTKGASNVSVVNTVTRTLTAGTTQPVTLSVSGLPSGVSASIANNPCNPTCSSAITLTVSPSASTGTHAITVTGTTAGLANKTTGFNLTINPPVDISVVTDVDPDPPTYVGHSVTWTCIVSGGVPPYTYTWTGTDFPSPANTASVNVTYQTTGAKVANCSVLDANGNSGAGLEQTIQVSLDPDFIEF